MGKLRQNVSEKFMKIRKSMKYMRAHVTLLVPAAIAIATLASIQPREVHAQGVRFTLAPSAEYVWWDKKLGIEDKALVGGTVGADFGLLSLSGYYHTYNNVKVTSDSLFATGGGLFAPRRSETDISTYGGNLALRFGTGYIVPFVSGGAGIIRFDPDSGKRLEQINYRYGGGIHWDIAPNLRATVMAEDSRFRLAPGSLYGAAPVNGSGKLTEWSNWTASAALGFAIGGSLDGTENDRWSLASLPVEAFAGRLDWDDSRLKRQALVGARTGIDVGQYVGLRGYYWQGRSGDLRDRYDIQSWGGEAQLNLNASLGPAPYLVVGAGRLDFGKDYRDNAGRTLEDETAIILGGGVGIRLSDQFRLNASVRDYLRGPQDLDSIASTSQITNNWLYSAGISYNFGRSRSEPSRDNDRMRREREMDREMNRADRTRAAAGQSRTDTVFVEVDPRTGERTMYRNNPRTGRNVRMSDSARVTMERGGDRVIMLPVPAVGELYVRYGDGTERVINPSMRMRGDMRDSMMARSGANDQDAQMMRAMRMRIDSLEMRLRSQSREPDADAQLIRGLRSQIDSLEMRVRQNEMNRQTGNQNPNVIVIPPSNQRGITVTPRVNQFGDTVVVGEMQPEKKFMGMKLREVSPYLAGFDQFVVGTQMDAGPIFNIQQLRLVPDFALGFGSDFSLSASVGAQYNLPLFQLNEKSSLRPHVRLGVGFLAASGDINSEFGINVAYGVTYYGKKSDGTMRYPRLFIEHQGISFFDTNRFLIGARWDIR